MLKRICCLLLFTLVVSGCTDATTQRNKDGVAVVEVGGCEYVTYNANDYVGGIVHHQNCKYCTQRAAKAERP